MSNSDERQAVTNPKYERFRPERHVPRMPIFWWVGQKEYLYFIIRELTSLFVGAYAVILIVQLWTLNKGAGSYEALLEWFSSPFSIVLHVIIFIFIVFHSITWFKLAPTAVKLKIGNRRISGTTIVVVNFLAWILVSAAVAWLLTSL